MNKRGDITVNSLLGGDVILSTGSGNVLVEQNGQTYNILEELSLIQQVASQLCWIAPNIPPIPWNPTSIPYSAWGMATIVINSQIYLIGGTNGTAALKTICIYDTIHTWNCNLTMSQGRAFPYAALSLDGLSLYIFGGFSINPDGSDGPDITTVIVYNLQTQTWSQQPPSSNMPDPHHRGSSAIIDNEIFFFGGTGNTTSVTSYQMSISQWKTTGPQLPEGRWNTAAVAVGNNIYVLGGRNSSNVVTGRVDILNTLAQAWIPGSNYVPLENPCATNVNNLIFSIGGYNPQVGTSSALVPGMNPRLNYWRTNVADDLQNARDSCSASFVNGMLYVIGGRYSNGTNIAAVPFMETVSPCF